MVYRVYQKKRNLGISQEIDIVLKTKDFRAWEFHKAKFMHLFNAQQQ